jgi:hypothetical protein
MVRMWACSPRPTVGASPWCLAVELLLSTDTLGRRYVYGETLLFLFLFIHSVMLCYVIRSIYPSRASGILLSIISHNPLVPDIAPNLIITTVCLDVCLIPRLWRADAPLREVSRLGGLAVGLDGTSLVQWDLAVVSLTGSGGAVCDFSAGELALYVCGVDAGFGC